MSSAVRERRFGWVATPTVQPRAIWSATRCAAQTREPPSLGWATCRTRNAVAPPLRNGRQRAIGMTLPHWRRPRGSRPATHLLAERSGLERPRGTQPGSPPEPGRAPSREPTVRQDERRAPRAPREALRGGPVRERRDPATPSFELPVDQPCGAEATGSHPALLRRFVDSCRASASSYPRIALTETRSLPRVRTPD